MRELQWLLDLATQAPTSPSNTAPSAFSEPGPGGLPPGPRTTRESVMYGDQVCACPIP